MNKTSMQKTLFIFLTSLILLLSCSLFPSFGFAAKKKIMRLKLDECLEVIIGSWKIVETNTMDELGTEIRYDFTREGKCRKNNVFNGYAEEYVGVYEIKKKGRKLFCINIIFEGGISEDYLFFFESRDRLNMTIIVDQAKLIYILERQLEHL